jgi:hypothetical protein
MRTPFPTRRPGAGCPILAKQGWGTDSMETDYPARVRPPPFDFVEEWGTHLKNARVPHPCSTRVGYFFILVLVVEGRMRRFSTLHLR